MKTTIRKIFWIWDFDKEENWLNEMARAGKVLTGVGFCKYIFEDAEPGEYTVRLELLKNHVAHDESKEYISFLEETGAEFVGNYFRWIYMRKKTESGEFQLYSDNASRVQHLNRIIALITPLSLANAAIGLSNLSAFTSGSKISGVGFVNLAIGVLGCFGAWRLYKKRKRIQDEARLFE